MKVVRIKAKGLRLAAGFGCSVGCDFEHEKLFQSIGSPTQFSARLSDAVRELVT
ncbi:MAG TPA: hypothetical protein VMG82_37130 [Candidatus Sulfotelmatobacter sp.]|nr:hypothetical protein [Candidatus Sulfotelmatobacter sp.]